jgi:hypothetical protein
MIRTEQIMHACVHQLKTQNPKLKTIFLSLKQIHYNEKIHHSTHLRFPGHNILWSDEDRLCQPGIHPQKFAGSAANE